VAWPDGTPGGTDGLAGIDAEMLVTRKHAWPAMAQEPPLLSFKIWSSRGMYRWRVKLPDGKPHHRIARNASRQHVELGDESQRLSGVTTHTHIPIHSMKM
jgi:hypothetical protein